MQQRFLLQILLLARHVSGTTMPIIRSSRVLYSGCCLWHFVLWYSSCWSGVELRVMCPVCRILQHPANRTHNPAIKTSVASSWHFISTYFHNITTKCTFMFNTYFYILSHLSYMFRCVIYTPSSGTVSYF